MARAKPKKTMAELEGEQWVKDKMTTLEKLANLANEVKQLREELGHKTEIISEFNEKYEALEKEVSGMEQDCFDLTMENKELKAQIDVLKWLIIKAIKHN